ncbi:MAG: glycine--tRNA ligase subunit beta [Alphaproteobacteria bacterium]|nr:glycine--tRNA ligase subunit beta [Alphaproteobacteria bacterium]
MPQLLIELFSEEIPARMQARAGQALQTLVCDRLAGAGLSGSAVRVFAGLRRLTLVVEEVPERAPDRTEERKGPRIDAPAAAIEGFLKASGLASVDAAERRDTGKGVVLFAVTHIPGRPAVEVLPALIAEAILALGWPKSMRWAHGTMSWVRPLRSIIALFDGAPLPGGISFGDSRSGAAAGYTPVVAGAGLAYGAVTYGHRFLAPAAIEVTSFADYAERLAAAKVVLDPVERRARIEAGAAALAASAGLTVVPDPALLDEVTGLVEWPVPLIGRIDDAFMDLPPEVMTTSMRSHQKYFACRTAEGALANRFIVVSNMETADGGAAIVAGNERVLRARLSDARFFWDQDRRQPLEEFGRQLADRVFHAKLGSVAERVGRITGLARSLAPVVGADPDLVVRAARLAKCDLAAGMVGEFPELQGVMGRYYALQQAERPEVAHAIADHYAPAGPNDRCPTAPVSVALALADKLDHLVNLMAAGERATGSGDPFGLRRAALGILRLIRENGLRLDLRDWLQRVPAVHPAPLEAIRLFVVERLTVVLRDAGHSAGRIAAVLTADGALDPVQVEARLTALAGFLGSDDGTNLLAAYKRATNILRIEEKRDGKSLDRPVDPGLLVDEAEQALHHALEAMRAEAATAMAAEDFSAAMAAFGQVRAPLDRFFDRVTVNADDAHLRLNRLALLALIRATFDRVAQFGAIDG